MCVGIPAWVEKDGGATNNHFLENVFSNINKPSGEFVMPNEQPIVKAFMSSFPIEKVSD